MPAEECSTCFWERTDDTFPEILLGERYISSQTPVLLAQLPHVFELFSQRTPVGARMVRFTSCCSKGYGVRIARTVHTQPPTLDPIFNFVLVGDDRAATTIRQTPHRQSESFPSAGAPWSSVQTLSDFLPAIEHSHDVPPHAANGQPRYLSLLVRLLVSPDWLP